MKQMMRCLATSLLLGWPSVLLAEAAWTRNGNCAACHTVYRNDLIAVFGDDGTADPNNQGTFKVFRAWRNQTKSLYVSAGSLNTGDRYAFGLKGFRYGGVTTGATLGYLADCDWANWGGAPGTYSYNDFYLSWGLDPALVSFDLTVGSAAVYDYYELIFMVAGKSNTGELFYAEEPIYLQVPPPNMAPLVTIDSPESGAVLQPAPIDIPITASASDLDGSIVRVEFFANGNKIGEDTSAPYGMVWSQVPKGAYSLTAKATDNDGATKTSTAVSITVKWVTGDLDGDSDVDQSDFGFLQVCLAGTVPVGPGCADADLNGDNLVNNNDVLLFKEYITGARE